MHYEVLVIGSGPAGQRAVSTCAKYRTKVGLIEKNPLIGGNSLNTGTIPSKSLREAAIYLMGKRLRDVYGESYTVKKDVTMEDLMVRCRFVMQCERDMIKKRMAHKHVEILQGSAVFVNPNTVTVTDEEGTKIVTADKIILTTGSVPRKPAGMDLKPGSIIDSDGIMQLTSIPNKMLVIGAGVIGVEYATIFASLNVEVTLVDGRPTMLDFIDDEISDALTYHMRDLGISVKLGEAVSSVEWVRDDRIVAHLESGKRIITESIMIAAGRRAATDSLNLQAAGIQPDEQGRVKVNEYFQTCVPHIYAAGDIIGFPSLASTSMEQGRCAARHACGREFFDINTTYPYGIYTIPEISMIGATEEELTAKKIPYETGVAQYRDIVRGRILGDKAGMLKILFHLQTREILGVHAIGEGATELIHIGQAVMAYKGTIDYFVDSVFNYPTLAEAYKVAALDAISKLSFA